MYSPTGGKKENRFTGQNFPLTHSGYQESNNVMTGESIHAGRSTIILKFRGEQKFSNTEGAWTEKHLQGEWRRKPTSSPLSHQRLPPSVVISSVIGKSKLLYKPG